MAVSERVLQPIRNLLRNLFRPDNFPFGKAKRNKNPDEFAENAFFDALFTIMGHLAKVDGRVSKEEIVIATKIMEDLELSKKRCQDAVRLFTMGKASDFPIEGMLNRLCDAKLNPEDYELFLRSQYRIVYADGYADPASLKLMSYISKKLGISQEDQEDMGRSFRDSYTAKRKSEESSRSSDRDEAPSQRKTSGARARRSFDRVRQNKSGDNTTNPRQSRRSTSEPRQGPDPSSQAGNQQRTQKGRFSESRFYRRHNSGQQESTGQTNHKNSKTNNSSNTKSGNTSYRRVVRTVAMDAYGVLGLTPDADNNKITIAYRRLVSKYHPDRVIAQGGQEEQIRIATDKMRRIRAAYEQLKQQRGF